MGKKQPELYPYGQEIRPVPRTSKIVLLVNVDPPAMMEDTLRLPIS